MTPNFDGRVEMLQENEVPHLLLRASNNLQCIIDGDEATMSYERTHRNLYTLWLFGHAEDVYKMVEDAIRRMSLCRSIARIRRSVDLIGMVAPHFTVIYLPQAKNLSLHGMTTIIYNRRPARLWRILRARWSRVLRYDSTGAQTAAARAYECL